MQLQVKDLKRLSKLSNCKLIAGKEGLSKDVRWFFVCFFDDVEQWIYEKEVVFLPGVGINTNTKNLLNLMEQFRRKNVSAIYIIIGYQFYEVPEVLVGLADKYDIPLFEMPNVVPLVEITKELSEMILLNQSRKIRAENTFKDALFGHSSDIQWHMQNLKLLGYELCRNNYIMKIQFEDYTNSDESKNGFIDAALNACFHNLLSFQYEHNYVIGMIMTEQTDAAEYLRQCFLRLISMLHGDGRHHILSIGVSESFQTLCEAKQCLHHASQALKSMSYANTDEVVFFYEDMSSIFKIMQELDDNRLFEACCRHMLEPLIMYDEEHGTEYVNTLSVYMMEYGSSQRVTQILNIHRNTLLYRMSKIKEMLKYDLGDPAVKFELQIELYLYRYINTGRV